MTLGSERTATYLGGATIGAGGRGGNASVGGRRHAAAGHGDAATDARAGSTRLLQLGRAGDGRQPHAHRQAVHVGRTWSGVKWVVGGGDTTI